MRTRALATILLCMGCGDDDGATDGDVGTDVGTDAGTDVGADAGTDARTDVDADGGADADPGFVDPATLGLEADPEGQWYRGDLHVHASGASNDTGGDSTPERIKEVALERGLYFVVLTDHSNSTGSDTTTSEEDPALENMGPEFPYWDRVAELSEAGTFLMIDGNEISPVAVGERPTTPTGHIGCLPADLATFDRSGAFIDRPRGTVTGGMALADALERGCFTVLNHPYASTAWIAFDWTDSGTPDWGYDAVEVYNGTLGYASDDRRAYDLWRCDRLAGREVAAIGASDNHRVNQAAPGMLFNPALGHPATEVFAQSGTWEAIVAGMRAGATQVVEAGSRVQLDGYDAEGARFGEGSGPLRWIRLRVTFDEASRGELALRRATSCTDARPSLEPPVIAEDVLFEHEIGDGEALDVAFPVDGSAGLYAATLIGSRNNYTALSGAVRVP